VYDEFNRRLYTFLVRLSRRRDVADDCWKKRGCGW
jgi:hypothetical protein